MRTKNAAVPYVFWMAVFVVVPLVLIVAYAFTNFDGEFTLSNFDNIDVFLLVFGNSLYLALIATVICLLIAYPFAYFLAQEGPLFRKVAMLLIMLPMWMNFLLRTYAWMSILENNGFLNQLLGLFGLGPIRIINTDVAVVLGMVYNFLPFMILPIFSVIDKLDKRYIEAAQDLGANKREIFRRVIFPLSLPGVLSGVTMVFIPSISTFAISKLLGGGMSFLLGDLIEMQFLGSAYNPHLGSAIALLMLVLVIIATLVTQSIVRGFAYILCDGRPIAIGDKAFIQIGRARFLDIPVAVWIMIVAFIIFGPSTIPRAAPSGPAFPPIGTRNCSGMRRSCRLSAPPSPCRCWRPSSPRYWVRLRPSASTACAAGPGTCC